MADRNQEMAKEPKMGKGSGRPPEFSLHTGSKEPALGRLAQDAIGRSLQAHFDDIASAPVPDKFLVLLAELEAKEAGRDN
jgi:Anti-sigma factor NepR